MKTKIFNLRILLAVASILVTCSCRTTEDGYSKSVRANTILKTSADSAGQPIEYPNSGTPEISGLLVEIPVGQNTGWHIHPSQCIGYVLQGEIAVEIENGSRRTFKAGDSFAEVKNLKHCGYNTGSTPAKILLFAIGTKGTPVSKAASDR
jgi:quercetin dioxygenase-like cupin family protein